jgi:hypothetical protein
MLETTFTVVSCGNQCFPGHVKGVDNWGLRNNEAVIPENAEREPLASTMLRELILVLIPVLSERMGILHPGPSVDNSLHE